MIEYSLYVVVALIILAMLGEIIDSGLGMMYGTLLSPILISIGFGPLAVVPAILLSQAFGGATGTVLHQRFKNADFSFTSKHFKVVLAIVLPGLAAVLIGVYVALNIPSWVMKSYIGVLVIIMGFLCIFPLMYTFRWWKMYLVGVVSAFNKALSGGGFGPVTSTGKILGGLDAKVSIATTTYAEVPICLTSFVIWYILEGGSMVMWFPIALCVGAIIGAAIGPYVTANVNTRWLKIAVGVLAIASGIYLCYTVLTGFNSSWTNLFYSAFNIYNPLDFWNNLSRELTRMLKGIFGV